MLQIGILYIIAKAKNGTWRKGKFMNLYGANGDLLGVIVIINEPTTPLCHSIN